MTSNELHGNIQFRFSVETNKQIGSRVARLGLSQSGQGIGYMIDES